MIDVRRPWRAFAAIDRLEFDVELPPTPRAVERLDGWFNRLSEGGRIIVVVLAMLFVASSSMYLLGLGSTFLLNRAEATRAAQSADPGGAPATPPEGQARPAATVQATATIVASPTATMLPQLSAPPPTSAVVLTATLPPIRQPTQPTALPAPIVQPVPQQPYPGGLPSDVPGAQPQPQRPRIVATPEAPAPAVRANATRPPAGPASKPTAPPTVPPAIRPNAPGAFNPTATRGPNVGPNTAPRPPLR